MSRPLLLLCLLAALLNAGCGSEAPVSAGSAPAPASGTPPAFNPAECGTITGLVTWTGPVPNVPTITHTVPRLDGTGFSSREVQPPNKPQIDLFTRGLAGAVVFLRGVDPARAKPWTDQDHPPVTVEFRDSQIWVRQGTRSARTGFVQRGAEVTFQSLESEHHVLRGRGAAFFAMPFPEPNQPLRRAFDTYGRIELTNAAGSFWQSADLFVCDHPYYTVTDSAGRFEFTQVPAGIYDLVAWHPNWLVAKTDRNPESTLPSRLYFAPPLETSRPVGAVSGHYVLANLTLPK